MKIAEEKKDKLNSVLKIEIKKEDYQAQYDQAIKSAKKEMNMPGFRPGKAPSKLIEKKYGKSILAEEINKLVNESIYGHISENKLDILGNPIPSTEDSVSGDWENPEDFSFLYEMAYAPEFDVKLEKIKGEYYTVKIDDKLLEKEIEDMAKRFGTLSNPEVAEDKDLLMGTFVELNEDDEIKEGGIMSESTISIEYVEDKKTKKALVGLKPNDVVVVDPHKVFPSHSDLEKVLNITHAQVHDLKSNFKFNIKEVKRMTPSEINQDLFDKAFGKDNVKSEDEMREKVTEILKQNFQRDQDYIFKRDAVENLIDNIKMELPDTFMKRWIRMTNEKPITEVEIEAEYPNYARSIKWQLIEGKLAKENDLRVTEEDVMNFQKDALAAQYAQYGMPLDDSMLEEFAKNSLQNKEEVERVSQHLANEKIMAVCRAEMKVKEKEVSFDEFLEIAQKGSHKH